MNDKNNCKRNAGISSEEIDRIVVAQADEESAWEKPISVKRTQSAAISLSAELAARAAFFARLHRQVDVERWLRQIIEERIELEEAALAGVKRDLAANQNRI